MKGRIRKEGYEREDTKGRIQGYIESNVMKGRIYRKEGYERKDTSKGRIYVKEGYIERRNMEGRI
jgi:hypothetical protein